MNSTKGSIGNSTIPHPAADAWCVYEVDASNNPIILDSHGVSTVTRISAGRHRVFFSNPERFVSGAYVGLVQQEVGNQPDGYGTVRIHGTTQRYLARATGVSASCDIIQVGYNTPVGSGWSASPSYLVDASSLQKCRINAAFFCQFSCQIYNLFCIYLSQSFAKFFNITRPNFGFNFIGTVSVVCGKTNFWAFCRTWRRCIFRSSHQSVFPPNSDARRPCEHLANGNGFLRKGI